MDEHAKRTFETIADQCTGCGICAEGCEHLQNCGDHLPDEIAKILSAGDPDETVIDFIQKCSLCGMCCELCPEDLDIAGMVQTARSEFIESGIVDPEQYHFLWVDHDWNAFSLYRRTYNMDALYADLTQNRCNVLFFPGCMLTNEGPHLVQAAAQWLGQGGQEVGASLQCCGAPLYQMGLAARAKDYSERLWRSIEDRGVRRVVTACPTCHQRLVETNNSDLEVISIFKLMAEAGLGVSDTGFKTVTVHDSCTDRSGAIGKCVRKLLAGLNVKEMAHSGTDTICCGSGGIVSAVDPDICEARAAARMREVSETGADVCVTYCMACAHRLNAQSKGNSVRHILELVFNEPVDHEAFNEKNYNMWTDETGEENSDLLMQSEVLDLQPSS
ncbi:conserved hypothetical protein [Desulfosarcina cetonica]|nr:conserved hypothetical protein [Desulfosarcina cetonica]